MPKSHHRRGSDERQREEGELLATERLGHDAGGGGDDVAGTAVVTKSDQPVQRRQRSGEREDGQLALHLGEERQCDHQHTGEKRRQARSPEGACQAARENSIRGQQTEKNQVVGQRRWRVQREERRRQRPGQ